MPSPGRSSLLRWLTASLALAAAPACSGMTDDGDGDGDGSEAPVAYEYESRFEPGVSSVSYSGQTFRQVLVVAMTNELGVIQSEIDDAKLFEDGEVAERLYFYYLFDGDTAGSVPHALPTSPAPLQTTWEEISSGKDLQSKIAGNDEVGQHKDWMTEMVGWDGAPSPDELVVAWIEELDDMAVAYSSGQIPLDPQGNQIDKFYVSATGRNNKELMEKFLLGAINFSQGTDDYLDDDLEGKGLLSDNIEAEEDEPFTALEHTWDEGFGYWGGARNYLEYTDEEIAGKGGRDEFQGVNDLDGDGAIDLKSEKNFGAAVNAGKRDFGSAPLAPTDFSGDTMRAFLEGRHIIASADGALSADEMDALAEQRDLAVSGWEKALAATAVHYFNDTVQDMHAGDYEFGAHAGHWSELKGFLLALQFNPRSPLSDADMSTIHTLVGTTPVLPDDDGADAYVAELLQARDLLGAAYGFAADNIGDANGENGW